MTTPARMLTAALVLCWAGLTNAQQFNRLVDLPNYGRCVDLKPDYGVRTAQHPVTPMAPISYPGNPYGPYGPAYGTNYAAPASYAPTIPVSTHAIRPGGCYGGGYGNGGYGQFTYPVGGHYPSYTGQYPHWTANGGYGYNDEYLGRNLFGAPTRFDRDEPVRNIFRWLLP